MVVPLASGKMKDGPNQLVSSVASDNNNVQYTSMFQLQYCSSFLAHVNSHYDSPSDMALNRDLQD